MTLSPSPSYLGAATGDGAPPSDNTSVRVCLRVRPLLPYELTIAAAKILSYPNPSQLCIAHQSNPRPFTFDYVFDDFSTQQQVYAACVQPLVDSFTSGYNTTILAYGQTGSGKTHTMGTAASSDGLSEAQVGIIPRVIRSIFSTIREREQSTLFTVKVAFLEIYNEEIKDLLNAKGTGPAPYIREGAGGSIIVANTLEEEVSSYAEMMAQLVKGSQCRVTGSTAMNATSSRSHAVFSIILSQRRLSEEGSDDAHHPDPLLAHSEDAEVITSKFHFVDLAGSERLKRTGAVGERMKEGININQGLLALGNVISALGGERKAAHVPFRDSKITRMLQDSLGGNSKTLMIACVSPADVNGDETLNTLKYANRAKNIQNKPIINRDPNSAKIDALRQRIAGLEEAIRHWRIGDAAQAELALKALDAPGAAMSSPVRPSVVGRPASASGEEVAMLREQNVTLEAAVQQLSGRMKALREEMSALGDRVIATETERDVLRLRLEKARDGELKQEDDGPSAEVGVLEENRRTIARLSKKVGHQKRELDSAMKVIQAYMQGGPPSAALSGSPGKLGPAMHKKKRRRTRRKTATVAAVPLEESKTTDSAVLNVSPEEHKERGDDDDDGEDVDEDDSDGPESDHSPHDATVDEDGADALEGDDARLSELELSDADSADDEVTDTLSLLAELKEKEHEANLRQWTAEGVRLNADLTRATKELNAFHAQSANVLHLRVQYEKRISDMEREMEAVQAERDRVLRELDSTKHSSLHDYEQRYEAAVSKYRAQLTQLSDQLRTTREKLKENERMKRQLAADELRIGKLEAEIASAKKAKVGLAKRMEESAGKYREWCDMKDAKLASMAKESRKQSLQLKRVESELAKQSVVLQRRNEEKAVLQKQISRQQQQQQGSAQQHSARGQPQQATHSTPSARGNPPHSGYAGGRVRSPVSSSSRGARSTPLRRQPSRRHRESPMARAKAMASNAAAMSDSAAPQHPSSAASVVSEEALRSSIEQEIAAAVERSSRVRELEEARGKKALLQTELSRVQERMMSNEMSTAEQQREYSALEQQCTYIQATLTALEGAIRAKEADLQRLMPQASPTKPAKGGRREDEKDARAAGGVLLSGSEVDYRLFSRIKVGSLDAGKRALVYLIQQAVELSVERDDLHTQLERSQRELGEERRKRGEERAHSELRRKQALAMSRCTVTPIHVHYAVHGEDDEEAAGASTSAYRRHPTSPAPVSPRSPQSFHHQPAAPVPPLTNNFLGEEPAATAVEADHSGSSSLGSARALAGAGGASKKGVNVFARLTDTNSFTGMYRSIAEDKKHVSSKPQQQPQQKRPISFSQTVSQPKPTRPTINPAPSQLAAASAAAAAAAAARDPGHSKWLQHMDSPLLNWPPAATLSSTLPPSSTSSSPPPLYPAVDAAQGSRPTGSVFSRLTNPQLYTGAHRARFGLDVQTKHKGAAGEDGGAAVGVGSVGGSLSAGGPHSSSQKASRVVSPSRAHSRQLSHNDYSATYDSSLSLSLSSSALPTIDDERAASLEEPSRAAQPCTADADADESYLSDIRHHIRLSVERDHRPAGDDDDDDEEEEQPVFHFGHSPIDPTEDKENHRDSDGYAGKEARAELDGADISKTAAGGPVDRSSAEGDVQHWHEGLGVAMRPV